MRQGGSNLWGGQDAVSEIKMVRTCNKEEHICPNVEVREVGGDRFEGR